jgi:hypothetical protein
MACGQDTATALCMQDKSVYPAFASLMTPPPSPGPYAQACIAWLQAKGAHPDPDVALVATNSMATGLLMGLALGALDEEFGQRAAVELQDCVDSAAAGHAIKLEPSEIAEAAQRLMQDA